MTESQDAGGIATEIRARSVKNVAPDVAPADHDGRPQQPLNSKWRRPLSWCCGAVAWAAALAMLVVAGLRIFDHDGTYLLMWLNAFTRYIYLPAYACLAWAIWNRRWMLAMLSVPVIACHLTWLAPDFLRDRRFDLPANVAADAAARQSSVLRIFFANIGGDNEDPVAFLDEISLWDPDVIIFAEFFPWWQSTVAIHPAMQHYPYGSGRTLPFAGDVAVFSKRPLENPQHTWVVARMNLSFDVRVDDVPLRILGVHSPRPIALPRHDFERFWEKTIPQINSLPDPAVVIGDCNSTQHSVVYQTIKADRFRSAHEDRGRGYASSWPNGEYTDYPLPPIRIDQSFLSPRVECVQVAEGEGRGSDHKPIIVDVRIRPVAGGPSSDTP